MEPLDFDLDTNRVTTTVPVDPTKPTRRLLQPIDDEPGSFTLAIDNSSLENFNVCSRMAEYYLVHSREPAEPNASLSLGSALHKALEFIFKNGRSTEAIHLAKENILEHYLTHPVGPDQYRNAGYALDVFDRYCKANPTEIFQIVEDKDGPFIERSFRLPLGMIELNTTLPYTWQEITTCKENPGGEYFQDQLVVKKIYIVWTGRIDLLVSLNSDLWVLDHKTSSMEGESFWDDFYMSQAQIGYNWATRQIIGKPVKGTIINALITRKPTATGKGVEFGRRQYFYSDEQLSEWEHNTLTLVTDFLHHLSRGFFPMETKWCFGKYGKCKYFDVCRQSIAQRPLMLANQNFRDVTWNPENPD